MHNIYNPYAGALSPPVLRPRPLRSYVPLRAASSESVPALDYIYCAKPTIQQKGELSLCLHKAASF